MLIDSCFLAAQQLASLGFFWTMLEISTECEINAGFFKCVLPDDLMVLVMVMLYDLQDRKFQPRELLAGEQEGPIEV